MPPDGRPLARRPLALFAVGLATLAAPAAPAAPAAAAPGNPSMLADGSPSTQVGLQIFDHTNLSGGISPTGTISFALYAPSDSSCASPIFTSAVAVSGSGSADSARYTTSAAGTYRWSAYYGGDANNNPAGVGCNSPSQSVIASPISPAEATNAARAGGSIHATATIMGGWGPTGAIHFTVTGPGDTFCQGAPAFVSTAVASGPGTYDSGSFAPIQPGTYVFRVRYDGDSNNYGIGPTSCLDPAAAVAITAAQIVSTRPPPQPPPPPPPSSGPPPPPPAHNSPQPAPPGPPVSPHPPGTATPPSGSGSPHAAATGTAAGPSPTASPIGVRGVTSPTSTQAAPATTGHLVFRGPTGCVSRPFRVYVAGGAIRQVTYYLHGQRLGQVRQNAGTGGFAIFVDPRRLRRGVRYTVKARVGRVPHGAQTLRRLIRVCA